MKTDHPQLLSQHSEPGGRLVMRAHAATRSPIEHKFPVGCEPHSVFYTPTLQPVTVTPLLFPKQPLLLTHQQPIGGRTTRMVVSSGPSIPPSPISPNIFFKFPPALFQRSDSNRSILTCRLLMNNSTELPPPAMPPLHPAALPPQRRSSLAVQPTSDVLSATPSGLADPASLKESNASAFYHPSSCNSPLGAHNCSSANASPSVAVAQQKNRKKAVIIVDAMSTEILIASESVRLLFALKDRSLIGKKLADVFPHVEPATPAFTSSTGEGGETIVSKKGPAIVAMDRGALFSAETHRLKAVYGRPVDIVSSDGRVSTVSVWSYPLTTTAARIVQQRKPSAILSMSSGTASEDQCGGAIGIDKECNSTTLRTLNSDYREPPHSPTAEARSNKGALPAISPAKLYLSEPPAQRSKSTCSAYSPYLRVLQEESSQQQHSPDSSRHSPLLNARQTSPCSSPTSSAAPLDDASGPSEEKHRHCLPHPLQHLLLQREGLQKESADEEKRQNMGRGGAAAGVGGNGGGKSTASHSSTSATTPTSPNDVDDGAAAVMSSGDDEANEGTPDATCPEGEASALSSECFLKAGAPVAKSRELGVSWTNGVDAGDAMGSGIVNGGEDGAANRRWLITMEPINALHIEMTLGAKGRIFRTDDSLASVLGYDCASLLFGTEIHRLIPSLNVGVEWDGVEQLCCGITKKRNGVPFSVVLRGDQSEKDNAVASSYGVQVRSLSSINGVVTVTDGGTLYSFNENFLHELCGQDFHSGQRSDYDITELIPEFYEYMSGRHGAQSQSQQHGTVTHPRACSSASSASSADSYATAKGNLVEFELDTANCSQTPHHSQHQQEDATGLVMERLKLVHPNDHEIVPGVFFGLVLHIDGSKIPVRMEVSSLDMQSQPHLFAICIGFDRSDDYGISQLAAGVEGEGFRHPSTSCMNGSSEVVFTAVALGRGLPKQSAVAAHLASSMTTGGLLCATSDSLDKQQFASSAPIAKFSIGGSGFSMLRECDSDSAVDSLSCSAPADTHPSHPHQHQPEQQQPSTSMMSSRWAELGQCSVGAVGARRGECPTLGEVDTNNEQLRGEYSKFYDTFQVLGNGAFGSVMLAARKDTGLLAAAKFINKEKVLPESWVPSPKRGNRMVPIEVHLLENLQHHSIVRVLDVFENERYYQLVMEKLGYGIDLFEFIDHRPKMDEALISYIFRQIVGAVDYLHENHIVHRDLKDENVIIDQEFRCKLIDFGSAAFFGDQIVFSTFCGTMEYCSPEVLTGNKYRGPELEMWSCGILLYTLVYFENPFTHPQETIRGQFAVQWEISEGLYQVLSWLLQPNPQLRATVGEIKRHWWVIQKIDPRAYKFHELMRKCDLAQVTPPLYVCDLQNRLKSHASCGNLAVSAMHNGTANAVSGTRSSNQPSREHHSPNSGGAYLGLAT